VLCAGSRLSGCLKGREGRGEILLNDCCCLSAEGCLGGKAMLLQQLLPVKMPDVEEVWESVPGQALDVGLADNIFCMCCLLRSSFNLKLHKTLAQLLYNLDQSLNPN